MKIINICLRGKFWQKSKVFEKIKTIPDTKEKENKKFDEVLLAGRANFPAVFNFDTRKKMKDLRRENF